VGGRYEVVRLIGRGGMGEVHAARNLGTGRDVALKMIRGDDISAEQKRRFLREAKAATAICHPNVIDILDVFEDEDGTPVMVMELLSGETLAALRTRLGRLSLPQVATIMVPVLDALHAAHDLGIVHRDLKPDNIFLSEAAGALVPKVLDFGIAKVLDPTAISSETQGAPTNTGSLLGTPHYMSFEQAMSEKDIDRRSDIWSIGVILFELLTGRRPLEFQNLGGMYTAFLQGTVPSIREHVPELPDELAQLIDRCLVKERAGRLDQLGPLLDLLEPSVDVAVTETLRQPEQAGTRPAETTTGRRAKGRTRHSASSPGLVPAAAMATPAAAVTQGAFAGGPAARSHRSRSMLVGALAVAAVVGVGALVLRARSASPTDRAATASAAESMPGSAAAMPDNATRPGAESSAASIAGPIGATAPSASASDTGAARSIAPAGRSSAAAKSSGAAAAGSEGPASEPQPSSSASSRKGKGIVEGLPY
jgi:hypothetical protein